MSFSVETSGVPQTAGTAGAQGAMASCPTAQPALSSPTQLMMTDSPKVHKLKHTDSSWHN